MFRPLFVFVVLALMGVLVGCRPELEVGTEVGADVGVDLNAVPSQGFARLASDAVYAADQRPGRTVVVGVVNLSVDGYVVVYRENDGKPGKLIGRSALLKAGEHTKVSLTLDEQVMDDDWLVVALWRDDGDQSYDAAKDTAIHDGTGADIWMVTHVDANAPDPTTVQVNF